MIRQLGSEGKLRTCKASRRNVGGCAYGVLKVLTPTEIVLVHKYEILHILQPVVPNNVNTISHSFGRMIVASFTIVP